MQFKLDKNMKGFAVLEAIIILVVIFAIAGIGFYVVNRHHSNTASINSQSSANPINVKPGTTYSIKQLTTQDAQSEAATESNSDSQTQSNATSIDSAASNVEGAYNATSL